MAKLKYCYGLLLALIARTAFAQNGNGSNPINLTDPLNGACGDFGCVATKIISFMLTLAAPLCAIMALYGGFQMMTAAGDPEKFSKGKKTLIYAAIGFVVVLIANSVVQLIQGVFGP